jgi:hypothetical protein
MTTETGRKTDEAVYSMALGVTVYCPRPDARPNTDGLVKRLRETARGWARRHACGVMVDGLGGHWNDDKRRQP